MERDDPAARPSLPGHTLIVAEVGQNHNGSMAFAQSLVDIAAMPIIDYFTNERLPGVDAVKFQKRDMSEELTIEAFDAPYDSPHAFGPTYGRHREALELSYEEHRDLGQYAHEKGLLFVETLCSPRCVRLCEMVRIDYLKVASRDLTNVPLLRAVAATRVPVILSAGMGGLDDLDAAVAEVARFHEEITILHSVSEYPARYDHIGLPRIEEIRARYPRYRVGYSDHSIGIVVPVAAVCMGASVIEKHITLSRRLKGSDHAGALEPDGLWRMTRDIRNVERAGRPVREDRRAAVVAEARAKLARSLASARPIAPGETLTEDALAMLSPGTGLAWRDRARVLGRKAKASIPPHVHLLPEMFE